MNTASKNAKNECESLKSNKVTAIEAVKEHKLQEWMVAQALMKHEDLKWHFNLQTFFANTCTWRWPVSSYRKVNVYLDWFHVNEDATLKDDTDTGIKKWKKLECKPGHQIWLCWWNAHRSSCICLMHIHYTSKCHEKDATSREETKKWKIQKWLVRAKMYMITFVTNLAHPKDKTCRFKILTLQLMDLSWIPLYSELTVHAFNNMWLLSGIQEDLEGVTPTVFSNVGSQESHMVRSLMFGLTLDLSLTFFH